MSTPITYVLTLKVWRLDPTVPPGPQLALGLRPSAYAEWRIRHHHLLTNLYIIIFHAHKTSKNVHDHDLMYTKPKNSYMTTPTPLIQEKPPVQK